MDHTRFVGLDIHKERISISVAESGRSCAVEYLGEISNDPVAIGRLCDRLERPGKTLAFCYEAGPCGYGVHRQLTSLGHRCDVVAPSLIPTRPGDRVKTNRRDATMLARLHRAGELTPVWVQDAEHEAMRGRHLEGDRGHFPLEVTEWHTALRRCSGAAQNRMLIFPGPPHVPGQ